MDTTVQPGLGARAGGASDMLLRRLDAIAALNQDDREAVLDLPMVTRDVRDGQELVREGDQPTRCTVVVDGLMSWYKTTHDGRRQIVAFHVPGDIPDLHSLHLTTIDCTLVANTDCRVGQARHEDVHELCRRRPTVGAALWRSSLLDGAIFREWILGMGRRTARENAAHLLCEMLCRLDAVGLARDWHFDLPLTQSEIADALGLTPVSVNRALQELRAEGLVEIDRRSVHVHDWPGLRRAGLFDESYIGIQPASDVVRS